MLHIGPSLWRFPPTYSFILRRIHRQACVSPKDVGHSATMASGMLSIISRDSAHEALLKLLAPLFLGIIVNYFLWGVQITQSYYYYKSYRNTDKLWLKCAVGLLCVLDMLESVLFSQACWIFLVDGWGDLNRVVNFPGWGFYATPLMDASIASLVHFFYAQKIWTLLERPYSYLGAGLVGLLSCTQFTGALGGSIFIYAIEMTLTEFGRFKTWACVWLITAAVTDIIIAVLLAVRLSRSRTGVKATDDIVSKLIRLTVETGLATATVQLADIIVYILWPLESYHIFLVCVAPKVYSNSMLALLNSRDVRPQAQTLAWGSNTGPLDSIHIRTAQNFSVGDPYEHDDPASVKLGSHVARRVNDLEAESVNSYPCTFTNR